MCISGEHTLLDYLLCTHAVSSKNKFRFRLRLLISLTGLTFAGGKEHLVTRESTDRFPGHRGITTSIQQCSALTMIL